MAEGIFEQLAAERLFTPDKPGVEDTQELRAITPAPLPVFVRDDGSVYVRIPADHFPPGGLA